MQTLTALGDGLQAATCDVLNSTHRGEILEVRKMNKYLLQSGVFLLLLGLMSTSHSQGNENRYIPVFCDQGHSIQDAVDKATEGATISVWGTCYEAVLVDKDRLRFVGIEGHPTIAPPCCSPAFQIISDGVQIEGINITGAVTGIAVTHGSKATIVNNVISGSYDSGIRVRDNSQAILVRNQITNSGNYGILIRESSQARLSGNTVTGSNLAGVGVSEGASAPLAGNIITGNSIHGVSVQTNGTVNLQGGNNINGNGGFGVSCEESAVLLVNASQDFSGGNGAGNVEIMQGPPSCFVKNQSGQSFP